MLNLCYQRCCIVWRLLAERARAAQGSTVYLQLVSNSHLIRPARMPDVGYLRAVCACRRVSSSSFVWPGCAVSVSIRGVLAVLCACVKCVALQDVAVARHEEAPSRCVVLTDRRLCVV